MKYSLTGHREFKMNFFKYKLQELRVYFNGDTCSLFFYVIILKND